MSVQIAQVSYEDAHKMIDRELLRVQIHHIEGTTLHAGVTLEGEEVVVGVSILGHGFVIRAPK